MAAIIIGLLILIAIAVPQTELTPTTKARTAAVLAVVGVLWLAFILLSLAVPNLRVP